MAQHTPSEAGKRPLKDVLELFPTCVLCTWAFRLTAGLFGLKVINSNCPEHRSLPIAQEQVAWL
jgi:hypothetical protein